MTLKFQNILMIIIQIKAAAGLTRNDEKIGFVITTGKLSLLLRSRRQPKRCHSIGLNPIRVPKRRLRSKDLHRTCTKSGGSQMVGTICPLQAGLNHELRKSQNWLLLIREAAGLMASFTLDGTTEH